MMTNKRTSTQSRRRYAKYLILLAIGVIALAVFSLFWGRYTLSPKEIFEWFLCIISGNEVSKLTTTVLLNLRFPRIAAALLVGAALSGAGSAYQGVFRNPMVSPDVLGASAGAGLGASLAILLGASQMTIQLLAFAFGLLTVFLTCTISRLIGNKQHITLILVLAGMVVSALANALVSIIKYVADPASKLPEITYWLMGSFSAVDSKDLPLVLLPMLLSFVMLFLVRWRINLLSFGDEEATALGVNTKHLRAIVIVCSTMLTASAISLGGQIGWVGLVIPHLARMITGPDFRRLLPCSMLVGAGFLLIVDNVARCVTKVDLPLGILTAIIGAPFFVYLLFRGKRGWSQC